MSDLPNAPNVMVACSCDIVNMPFHSEVMILCYTKVAHMMGWSKWSAANLDGVGVSWDGTMTRSEDDELCLIRVQLEVVSTHPVTYLWYTSLNVRSWWGPSLLSLEDGVALGVICVDHVLHIMLVQNGAERQCVHGVPFGLRTDSGAPHIEEWRHLRWQNQWRHTACGHTSRTSATQSHLMLCLVIGSALEEHLMVQGVERGREVNMMSATDEPLSNASSTSVCTLSSAVSVNSASYRQTDSYPEDDVWSDERQCDNWPLNTFDIKGRFDTGR